MQPIGMGGGEHGAIHTAALRRLDTLTKPLGSLGRIEGLAAQLCAIQDSLQPRIDAPHVVVFAGDHGAAERGVSAYPRAVTAQMVLNYLAGGAAINVLARIHALDLTVVDAGVDATFDAHDTLIDAKIRRGTRDYVVEPAMTTAECRAALDAGAAVAERIAAGGSNTLVLGEMGIGNTGAATLLMHGLTGLSLTRCVGRGTGLDDAGLVRKLSILTMARARTPRTTQPLELLAEFGGYEIAMLVGALMAARSLRLVMVVDGFTVSVAAALAARVEPRTLDCCVFGHRSAEQAHAALLQELGVTPLLDLGMRLGEGTGGALAVPLLRAAAALFNDMATFESAGVSEKAGGVNELKRFLAALQYFTRLPVPRWVGHSQAVLDDSVRYFPAVGMLVGAIGAAVLLGAARLWPGGVALLVSMIATLVATGAFHEDGLADAVDGLGGGLDRNRALAIMKDSRIGAFGAIALGMALLLKFVTLNSVPLRQAALLLLAGHAVSRLGAVFIMTRLPYVRESDDSRSKPLVQQVSMVSVAIAALTGTVAVVPLGWAGGLGILAVGLVCCTWALYLRRRLGGYTGDCLGAAQQLGECAFYLACTAAY